MTLMTIGSKLKNIIRFADNIILQRKNVIIKKTISVVLVQLSLGYHTCQIVLWIKIIQERFAHNVCRKTDFNINA